MDVNGQLPGDFPARLVSQLPPQDQRRVCVVGDVTIDGRYGQSVLAADERRIYYGPTDGNGRLESLPLEQVRDVRVSGYVGNGSLFVDRESDSVEVARFSQSRLGDFETAAGRLLELVRERTGGAGDGSAPPTSRGPGGRRLPRCPQCGRTLSPRAEVCYYCADKRKLLLRLLSLLRPHWKLAAVAMSLTLAATVLGLAPPRLIKPLIDRAILPGNMGLFAVFMVAYAVCFLVMTGLNVVRLRLLGWLGQRIIYDLRMKGFNRLQELSLRYYESKQTGKLMSRLTNDTERVERFVVEGLQEIIVDVLTLALILGLLLQMSWQLTVAAILPSPIVAALIYYFSKRIKSTYRKAWRTSASLTAHLADIIPGVRVVKGFAREKEEHERFERRAGRLMDHNVRAVRLRAGVFPFINLVAQAGYVMVWTIGGYMALSQIAANPDIIRENADKMIGTLVAFSMLLWRFYEPIGRLSRLSDQIYRATTSAERVFELLDAFPDVSEPARPKSLPGRARGQIEFRNLNFCYESNVPVLRNVSLTIQPGEMVGIVGQSGVGKSTLASLLLRFYDPDQGQVLLDGVDIRELSTHELRRNIGLVLQEPTLFHGSVRNNICYGKADAAPEEVIEAARIANAHRFLLRLPEGYDTEIGERGVRLSQGEKQRISIARAVLRDPPILILDEATASVDTETERLIQAALDKLIRGRTVLAIAHRLSTLRHADRIIVLSEGRIAEMGTHDELVAAEGLYYQLCQAQSMLGQNITSSPKVRPSASFEGPDLSEQAETPAPAEVAAVQTESESEEGHEDGF